MPVPPPRPKKFPENMSEQELLIGIYRYLATIRGIAIYFLIVSLLGVLAVISALGQTTN